MSRDINAGVACEEKLPVLSDAEASESTGEHDETLLDPRALRRCLGQFATGVTVMTAQSDGEMVGVTANSFSSLSLEPPLILWSINKLSRSLPIFQAATHFAVNILSADQVYVSQAFSRPDPLKFSKVSWTQGVGGAPVLDGVVATIICRPEAFLEGGDHIIIIGRVVCHEQRDAPVLLFSQGRYCIAEDHPELKSSTSDGTSAAVPGDSSGPLLRLLDLAHQVTSANFEDLRRAEQLTVAQIRLLARLGEGADSSIENLASRAFLGQRDAEDELIDLIGMGYVKRSVTGEMSLSLTQEGRVRLEHFKRTTREYERDFLADFSADEVKIGRRFLARLIAKHSVQLG